MKYKRFALATGAGLLATITVAACGSDNGSSSASSASSAPAAISKASGISCGSGTLTLAGSSAQANAISQWTKDYQSACPGATVNYNPSGSGAGVTSFEQNQVDFAGSDFPLAPADQPKADARCTPGGTAVDIPLVPGAIGLMYNVPGVTKPMNLSASTLGKIFNGAITTWNDAAIKADNPGVNLPGTKITTFHRSDKSGTSFNFSNYLNKTAPGDFPAAANKQWPGTGGQGENGSSGVAQAVKTTQGGIGYAEVSYAQANHLPTAKVGNAKGQFVTATTANASAFIAHAGTQRKGSDLRLDFAYGYSNPKAYPAVLVTYEIACASGNKASQLPLIKGFLTYAAGDKAQGELPAAGYVQLPKNVQTLVKSSVASLK